MQGEIINGTFGRVVYDPGYKDTFGEEPPRTYYINDAECAANGLVKFGIRPVATMEVGDDH